MMERKPTFDQRAALFQRMIDNSRMLAENGVMVSAETMLNKKRFLIWNTSISKSFMK